MPPCRSSFLILDRFQGGSNGRSGSSIAYALHSYCTAISNRAQISRSVEKRIQSIESEVAKLDEHPWAGKYRRPGFDSQFSLFLAPVAGALWSHIDLTGKTEAYAGEVSARNGVLSLKWDATREGPYWPSVDKQLILVTWDPYSFLVPLGEIHSFCLQVKESKTAAFSYWVRPPSKFETALGGWPNPKGKFRLPESFEVFRKLNPIESVVLSATSPREVEAADDVTIYVQELTLKGGSESHIYPGMNLEFARRKLRLEITAVEVDSCTAVAIHRVVAGRNVVPIKTRTKAVTPYFTFR